MARGAITHTQIVRTGVAAASETIGNASDGHTTVNDGRVFVLARNSNGSSTARTVTFLTPGTVDGLAVADKTVSIPAGESRYIGPFPVADYGRDLDIDVSHAEMVLRVFHL